MVHLPWFDNFLLFFPESVSSFDGGKGRRRRRRRNRSQGRYGNGNQNSGTETDTAVNYQQGSTSQSSHQSRGGSVPQNMPPRGQNTSAQSGSEATSRSREPNRQSASRRRDNEVKKDGNGGVDQESKGKAEAAKTNGEGGDAKTSSANIQLKNGAAPKQQRERRPVKDKPVAVDSQTPEAVSHSQTDTSAKESAEKMVNGK